ncbi:hypothetical protein DQ384_08340 [Sphaerisporangium album]|uniref:Uncharacterized protein n=1 Tax=Sphaerisporangium album TaxID=509200 RepID=A0A367FP18_9ACTN|nr:hypothetical protein DQ384_08340 [Sphaerisporangium album]
MHWALPDGLTRLVQDKDGKTQVRAVPNRWLVTRSRAGRVEAEWVVESDFLDEQGKGVTYPVDRPVPFRRLGRTLPRGAWRADLPGEHLPLLSAVGYGEPTFAAFYPNCHSVFGFHDPAFDGPPPAGVAYEVLGWYADQDPLTGMEDAKWREKLGADLGWAAPKAATKTAPQTAPVAQGTAEDGPKPERMVCYARIVFQPAPGPVSPLSPDAESGVWVGTTATEALAGHLGASLPGLAADQGPDEVENLLEALSFADELESKPLDVGARLAEARHAGTFRGVPSGVLWTIRRDDGEATAEQRQLREALRLDHGIGDLLNALNTAQEAYDREQQRLLSAREQLFADWYKYQLCVYPYETSRDTYPDPDEVRHFLERRMENLADLTARTGTYPGGAPDTLAWTLESAETALKGALDDFNAKKAAPVKAAFVADRVGAPQYYLPSEPVVLLTGRAATPGDRYGRDGEGHPGGLLPCATVPVADPADLTELRARASGTGLGADTWTRQPWHPVLLQWEVEFFPAGLGDNLDTADRNYDRTYITGNYAFQGDEPELKPLRDVPGKAANVYTGSTVLSASARPVLSARVLRYLAGTIVVPYTKATTGTAVEPEEFLREPETVLAWYEAHGDDRRLRTLVAIYRHLSANEDANLSQVLGGFNDALLMRRLTRQLPIADPLGFPDYQAFASRVAKAVGDDTRHAPFPLSDFNPIRAGALRVLRLRIVGSFGIPFDVDVERISTTTQLRVRGHPDWVAMPPRLSQPARLAFRWLDSDHDLREMNDVPVTSPICGWIVPDDLDDGLAVHDAEGRALGVLAAVPDPADPALARWRPAPGGTTGTIGQIGNDHLRDVARRLARMGPDRLATLLSDLDGLLAGVEPEDYEQGPLFGVALAVVRAEIDLQLMGLPAIHQDWNVFRQDMRRSSRESNDFPLVRFPVRIGDRLRLNDGLIGFWTEDGAEDGTPDGALDGTAGGAKDDAEDGSELRLVSGDPQLELALDLPPRRLTMLVDPRAPVHLTSGILPCKALRIPPDHYRAVLADLRPSFFAAPMLTDADRPGALPVPAEPGRSWTWRQLTPAGWTAVPVTEARPDSAFPARPTLREGWLTLDPAPTPAPSAAPEPE